MTESLYKRLSDERKQQQEAGNLPEWYSTGGYQMFKTKYLYDAPHWKAQIQRICKAAAKHTDNKEYWEPKFYALFWNGWLSPSTPVLANMGTSRGLPVSCSGCYVDDSVSGFYEAATEIAVLSKHGFGTSAYIGDIRPRGDSISIGGKASGVLPVVKMLTQVCRDISQGSSRRGAGAWYYDINGGDFWEILHYLEANPDDLNIGWNVPDAFIEALNSGDEEALSRYQAVLRLKMTLGKGYLSFIDRANAARPQWYKDHGLDVKASNLCVTADQLAITSGGLVTVGELYESGSALELFDGQKLVEASPMQLIETDADVFEITLNNGMSHKVTSYHKVLTDGGMKMCSELNIGDKVRFQKNEGLFGDTHCPDIAFIYGQYQADGTQSNTSISLCLWEDQFDLIPVIEGTLERLYEEFPQYRATTGIGNSVPPRFRDCSVSESVTGKKVAKKRLTTCILKKMGFQKGSVPDIVLKGDKETQWAYIKGLFYADGTVNVTNGKGSPIYLSIANTEKDFLKQLQLVLANLGLSFSLSIAATAGKKKLPDGKGGYAQYDCKECYRLVCGNKPDALVFEENTGFLSRKGVFIESREYRDNTKKYSEVKSIQYVGKEDVYCTTVDSDEHIWTCNGFITSNCSEIILHSSNEYTYTCVLSSMNTAKYDEWKDTDAVFTATVFLDCVASEFISRAKKIKHLNKAVNFTEKGRALGLGQMGLFSLFQKREISPESFDAHMLNIEVQKRIAEEAERATRWMAVKWGEPEWCEGYGRRNTHLMAIAPTKSTALLMGGWSEGINPDPAMAFSSSGAAGDIDRVNPVLLDLIKKKGLDVSKCTSEILANNGSVQAVSWLTDEEKSWFKTAFEIDQGVLIRYASARQQFIDQGQSVNLFFAHDDDEKYISNIHQQAFEDKNLLGLYYVYSSSNVKADRTGECEACQ